MWTGAPAPRGYSDITSSIDMQGLDFLNLDSSAGNARSVFDTSAPSALSAKGKGKGKASGTKDFIASDTDEQLMLYIPFQSTLKIHSLQLTSCPASESEDADEDEEVSRPKTIHIYSNRANVLGFDEAEGIAPLQVIELSENDWDAKTGTAKVELRFVKFQNVTSLVIFVVDNMAGSEKTRVDRVRILGETGETRKMGKLEKIGDEQGE